MSSLTPCRKAVGRSTALLRGVSCADSRPGCWTQLRAREVKSEYERQTELAARLVPYVRLLVCMTPTYKSPEAVSLFGVNTFANCT